MARKNKLEEQRRRARRHRRQRMTSLLVVVLAVVALAGAVSFANKGKRDRAKKATAAAVAAGCTATTTETDELAAGAQHLNPPATGTYKTNPPNSGVHYGANPITGVFGEARQAELWLHNLEHGHVGILYKDSLAAPVKTALEKFAGVRNTLTFMVPDQKLPEDLVFVSWTKLMRCAKPTDAAKVEAAATAFFDTNVGNAPEGKIPGQPNAAAPVSEPPVDVPTGAPS